MNIRNPDLARLKLSNKRTFDKFDSKQGLYKYVITIVVYTIVVFVIVVM